MLNCRCSFDLAKFVRDQKLILKSVNWLQSKYDGYAVFQRAHMMHNEMETECKRIVPNIKFEDGKPKCSMEGSFIVLEYFCFNI